MFNKSSFLVDLNFVIELSGNDWNNLFDDSFLFAVGLSENFSFFAPFPLHKNIK